MAYRVSLRVNAGCWHFRHTADGKLFFANKEERTQSIGYLHSVCDIRRRKARKTIALKISWVGRHQVGSQR